MTKSIRNIGIVAHVDAGKTTLSEQLLYKGGAIRQIGRVDLGSAHTDSLPVERERGISVKAAEGTFEYKGVDFHLIDTPGHIDFSGEVERSLQVLDGAIMVISAIEGIQTQTEVYFNALKQLQIPTIIFINKIDRMGVDIDSLLLDLNRLTHDFLPMQKLVMQDDQMDILPLTNLDFILERDEALFNLFIENPVIDPLILNQSLTQLVHQGSVFPLYYGSALKDIGILPLMEGIINFLPEPSGEDTGTLSGVVYKISRDKTLGKMVHVRLYQGMIKNRDELYNVTKDTYEKVAQIKQLNGLKLMDTGVAYSGEYACLAGLTQATIGDVLGDAQFVPNVASVAKPLLRLQVYPKNESELISTVEALHELEEEDPLLSVEWVREKREIHIQIMGMIQLEVLESILKERFNLEISHGSPSVIYKETLLGIGYGFDAYTMPKPCWAILKFKMEPLPRGLGLIYSSTVNVNQIKVNYQREVERRVPEALLQGLYGWEVIDVKITLVDGEDHFMHTHPGDFIVATPMAIMDGLRNIGTTLLEPIQNFRITAPEDCSGKIMGEMIQMRSIFESTMIEAGLFTITGTLPVSTSLNLPVRLSILTKGKGTLTLSFHGYQPCKLEEGTVRERIGVNPLDRAKYILSIRKAI